MVFTKLKMNCGYCGSIVDDDNIHTYEIKTNKKMYFCDDNCLCVYHREGERPKIEKYIREYTEFYKDCTDEDDIHLKRYLKVKMLMYKSFLLRKPRAELEKLIELHKKMCANLIEVGHAVKDDFITFKFGEDFKKDFDFYLDIWCS